MRSHLAICALGVLAVGVEAQSRTVFSGLNRRVKAVTPDSDTCGVLDRMLTVGGEPMGVIEGCACLSTIPTIMVTNQVASHSVDVWGAAAVTVSLTTIITESGTLCEYPAGAIPGCDAVNNDPCAYTCDDGLVACNGLCVASCPSPGPTTQRRRAAAAFDRVANRRRMCPRGFTPCGIFEQRGQVSEPWECVDVRYELESCGGCMMPFDSLSPLGVDCTAIPGVADVSCMRGSCVVRRCLSGYAVSGDRSQCVPV